MAKCNINFNSHRDIILSQPIKVGEDINSDSMNLKFQAVKKSSAVAAGTSKTCTVLENNGPTPHLF